MDRDHVHLMILSQPKLAPAQIVRHLKAESPRLIWQEHPELKRQFWKKQIFWRDGYFCVSAMIFVSANKAPSDANIKGNS